MGGRKKGDQCSRAIASSILQLGNEARIEKPERVGVATLVIIRVSKGLQRPKLKKDLTCTIQPQG